MKKSKKPFLLVSILVLAIGFGVINYQTIIPSIGNQSQPELIQQRGNYLSVDEANQYRNAGAFMLDVRTQAEWSEVHIPGATLIPLDELGVRMDELPADEIIVIYCRSGNRSGQALDILLKAGYSDVFSMEGGIQDWITAGYDVE
jgi:rhodanese-related sulfurtransferase